MSEANDTIGPTIGDNQTYWRRTPGEDDVRKHVVRYLNTDQPGEFANHFNLRVANGMFVLTFSQALTLEQQTDPDGNNPLLVTPARVVSRIVMSPWDFVLVSRIVGDAAKRSAIVQQLLDLQVLINEPTTNNDEWVPPKHAE